jgi:hypothetical protein
MSGPTRFPTNDEYEEALQSHRSSYSRTTARWPPCSLCRIVTAPSFEFEAPAFEFIMQIDKVTYGPYMQNIKDALKGFRGRAAITDVDEAGAQLYHPNGKQNEDVYRITFTEPAEDPEIDRKAFRGLLRTLRCNFLQNIKADNRI